MRIAAALGFTLVAGAGTVMVAALGMYQLAVWFAESIEVGLEDLS